MLGEKRPNRRFFSDGESGIGVLVLVLFITAFLSVVLSVSTQTLKSRNAATRSGSAGQIITATIVANIREGLANRSSCASLNAALRRFRVLGSQASPLNINANAQTSSISCLFDGVGDERKNLVSLQIRIHEIRLETQNLFRDLNVSLTIELSDPLQISANLRSTYKQTYRINIASLDNFALTLRGSSYPLIKSGGPSLTLFGSGFYAGRIPISPEQITSLTDQRTIFQNAFLVRPPVLTSSASLVNLESFKQVFRDGIETNVLNSPILDAYLPDLSSRWRQGFDFYYANLQTSYVIPQSTSGTSTAGAAPACALDKPYVSSRAYLPVIPHPQSLDAASKSCSYDPDLRPVFHFMAKDLNFTINLEPGDNIFCGYIVARQLNVNLAADGDYALFGHLIVDNLVISGPAGARLGIYHPMGTEPLAVNLPSGRGALASIFKGLSLSTAYNFYLPIAQNSPLVPRSPDAYLSSCSLANFVGYRSTQTNALNHPSILSDMINAFYMVSRSQ